MICAEHAKKCARSCWTPLGSAWRQSVGPGAPRVNLDDIPDVSSERAAEMIALDDALTALAVDQPRKARIVELRFFAGLSVDETAAVLKVSSDTVKRDWRLAKLWLRAALEQSE